MKLEERALAAEAGLAEAERKLAAANAKLAETEQRLAEIAFSSPHTLQSPAVVQSRPTARSWQLAQTAPPRMPVVNRESGQLADIAVALEARCALSPIAGGGSNMLSVDVLLPSTRRSAAFFVHVGV